MTELEAELEGVRARVLEIQAAEAAPVGFCDSEWAAAVAERDRVLSEIVALKVSILLTTNFDCVDKLDVVQLSSKSTLQGPKPYA